MEDVELGTKNMNKTITTIKEREVNIQFGLNIAQGEIQFILTLIRLNKRWNQTDNPIVQDLRELRECLASNNEKIGLKKLLEPFLDLISAAQTVGPITGAALSSITKFLSYEIMDEININEVAEAINNCKFESTNTDSDEVVILKIMQALIACVRCSASGGLSKRTLVDILTTLYKISTNFRHSELLRKSAEQSLIEILQILFIRLPSFREQASNQDLEKQCENHKEVMEFLCSLIEPSSNSEVRALGLTLVNVVIESSGHEIVFWPSIVNIVKDRVFKCLIQNIRSQYFFIVARAIRLFSNIFHLLKHQTKPQIELFFQQILFHLTNTQSPPQYEIYETLLDFIVELLHKPFFAAELFVGYDCQLSSANLLETLAKFLSKNTSPPNRSQEGLTSINITSFDGFLATVNHISKRCTLQKLSPEEELQGEELKRKKQAKKSFARGAESFNNKPTKGLEYLQSIQVFSTPLDPKQVAMFFRNTPNLQKKKIGEYLGEPGEIIIQVTREFVRQFDFRGQRIDQCLRMFLEAFRLPGESQKIERIIETFARHFFDSNPNTEIASADAAFTLSYSIIMLHTDAHNEGVKVRMTFDQWVTNNSKINDGKDFSREFLIDIYKSITSTAIRMSDESPNGEFYDGLWLDIVKRSEATDFHGCSNAAYDKEMFATIYTPFIAAISVVFDSAESDAVLDKALHGFRLCAAVSAHYSLHETLDNVVIALCKFTTLLSATIETFTHTFGYNKRAHSATITLFEIARNYGHLMRESWRNVIDCLLNLRCMGYLPADIVKINDFLEVGDNFKVKEKVNSPYKSSGGLLSSFIFMAADDTEAQGIIHECIKSCNLEILFDNTSNMAHESLVCLVKALLLTSVCSKNPSTLEKDNMIFCLELLVKITLQNMNRPSHEWRIQVYSALMDAVKSVTSGPNMILKSVFGLIRFIDSENHLELFESALQALVDIPNEIWNYAAEPIALGLVNLVESRPHDFWSPASWVLFFRLIQCAGVRGGASLNHTFKVLKLIIEKAQDRFVLDPAILSQCVETVLSICRAKYKAKDVPACLKSIDILYELHARILQKRLEAYKNGTIQFSNGEIPQTQTQTQTQRALASSKENVVDILDDDAVLEKCWLTVIHALCHLCYDEVREMRNHSLTLLQRALLSNDILQNDVNIIKHFFTHVLFPLLQDLLNLQGGSGIEASAIEETRLRTFSILPKLFLQYLPNLRKIPDFHDLWLRILVLNGEYMKAGNSDLMSEVIPESLKNMLLVMSGSGFFANDPLMWEKTWSVVNTFLPWLRYQLFPDGGASPSLSNTSSTPPPPSYSSALPPSQPSSSESRPGSIGSNVAMGFGGGGGMGVGAGAWAPPLGSPSAIPSTYVTINPSPPPSSNGIHTSFPSALPPIFSSSLTSSSPSSSPSLSPSPSSLPVEYPPRSSPSGTPILVETGQHIFYI